MLRVGFIGMGLMGIPMSKNILKKGFPLTVYNRTKEKAEELQALGATIADNPSDVAKDVDVVITMVTAAKDVESVLFGMNGVIAGANKGLIVIDMSTIGPSAAKNIAERLARNEIDFLDAPVTGSTPKAITGELTIFIGGEEDVYKKVQPVLEAMGTNLQYMGPVGRGQAIKLINNHLIAASITALAEGMLLADAMDLPREKAAEVLKTVPAMSGFMNLKLPNYVTGEYPLLFSAANMKKDVCLAQEEAKKVGLSLPVLTEVVTLYEKAIEESMGSEDMSSIIKLLKD